MKYQFKINSDGVGIPFYMLIFLCIPMCPSSLFAQNTNAHVDVRVEKAFAKAVDIYDSYIGKNSFVFTGRSYYDPHNGIRGHQFFKDDYWEHGDVVYDGKRFDSLYLKYDVYKDELLIEHFNSTGQLSPINPYKPKVSSFSINDNYFVRLEKDTLSGIREGFYNVMYDSEDIQVLIRRRKEIVNSNEINTIREMFIEKDRYYIKKDGQFHQVRKKRSILKVLSDRKKELKGYIRANSFFFKNNPDEQLVEVVKYYDTQF